MQGWSNNLVAFNNRSDAHKDTADEQAECASQYRLDALEPRLLLSADPISAELARVVQEDATVINAGDFITYEQGNAGLKFTPPLNSTTAGSFDVESSEDGTSVAVQSGIATSTITVIPETITYDSAHGPMTIPDHGKKHDTKLLSTLEVTDAFTIFDLNVQLDIDHQRDEDLDVFLISPSGTRIELFTDVGGKNDNFEGTILDDEAVNKIKDGTAPFAGTFQPEGDLGLLEGEAVKGTWTLEVSDDKKHTTGTLNSWSITVERVAPAGA